MLSNRLVACIEEHSEGLASAVTERIRRDPELARMGKLQVLELREISCELLRNLGDWLAGDNRETIARQYEEIGKKRCAEDIPLHECVRSLQIVKSETIDYVRGQGFAQTSLEIYAEEELEHRLNRFIDFLIYHLVRGYEAALRRANRRSQEAGASQR